MTGSESVSAVLLVVDPDPTVADNLQTVLTARGHNIDIETSSNWAAAIENVQSVDCVVTEYDLPETDGLDVLSRVKQEGADLPVILYTDSGDETIASQAISAGVTDYLQKDGQDLDLLATRIVQAIRTARTTTRARELNRINAVIQEIDAALVRAESRSQVEQTVCDILADADPYLFAWIGEYEPVHNRLVPCASARLGDGFLDEIPLGEESTLPESRAGTRTIETGQVAVTQNLPEDAALDDVSEEISDREDLSLATVPITHGDGRYGLLVVYADRPSAFDREERELLEKLGRDVGYTINAVAVRSELQDFREAVEHAGHAVCITDADGTIEHVNPAFEVQTGYDEPAAVGSPLSSIQSLTPDETTLDLQSLEPGEETTQAFTATRTDGTTYEAEQTIAPIIDPTGDPQGFVVIQADVTERREQATALRRETEMLNSLLETSPIGIVVLSPAGEIVRANQRAETVLGLEESEITDRTFDEPQWEFTDESEEPIPRNEHPFNRVLEEQAPIYDLELRMERQHGDPIWVSINGAPQFDPDGDLERVVFTFDDITEIKETQRELEEINQTLEALIQAAPVGIVAFDLDGGISLWSDGAEDIFGWSANEVLGSHDPPHVQEEAVNEYETFIEQLEQGEELTGLHVVRQRKDGSEVDLHLSAAPIRDTHGWVTGLMAVFADLSDQMAREQQLRQFRKVVEHAGHSVMITDSNGKIQYVNAAFEEQTGYSTEEALGRTPAFLKSGEHDEAFYEEMWETIQRGDVWEREIVNRRKDGEKIYVDQTIAPVLDEEGEIEHFVAVNTDITDRKEYEQELERQNQRLEEFASVVSHDLRNPLNVARGSLDILDVEGEHAVRLAEALDRMDAIIDDVLTLAREGQSMTSMGSVNLEAAVRESWEAIESVEAELSVEDLPTVTGDSERAQRIFENLFRNAVEHGSPDRRNEKETSEESGSGLRISVGSLDSGGFFVEDDGPGIDPEMEETVFRSGVTTAENGTGLGLSIVRRLAEAQGWSVSLREGRMGGARFEFRTDR